MAQKKKKAKVPKKWKKSEREKLVTWIGDVYDWCQRVRLDIIRLEGAAGFPPAPPGGGEPGDPPEPPWGFD